MKICPWGLQHYTNLLLGKITDIVRRIFHSGSSNIIIFFMGKTLLTCQDWINENGLFVWICSKIYQHLIVKLQEQDLRLGTNLGDWIRKRSDDSSSWRDHQCAQHCHLSTIPNSVCLWYAAHWSMNSQVHKFWHCPGRWSDQLDRVEEKRPVGLCGHWKSKHTRRAEETRAPWLGWRRY